MQKYMITPQKKANIDLKELSPLPSVLSHHHRTTKLQILQSPGTPNKDLFHQLLSFDTARTPSLESPCNTRYELQFEIMEEEDSELFSRSQMNDCDQNEESQSMDDNEDDEYGMRKRKRKSTAQIKVLKAQLEHETNWSKEKIVEMSEKTGLSQSQVYKWWWDQKKKNAKNHQRDCHNMQKRKMIRRDQIKKGIPYQKNSQGYYIDESVLTKPKTAIDIEQVPQTERKISKRLVFM